MPPPVSNSQRSGTQKPDSSPPSSPPSPGPKEASVSSAANGCYDRHRVQRIRERPFERVAPMPALGLHVPDRGLDRAAPFDHRLERSRDAALLSRSGSRRRRPTRPENRDRRSRSWALVPRGCRPGRRSRPACARRTDCPASSAYLLPAPP